jgi:hypothetical protein
MSKPETLKDIIEETMRVSGVPYPVPGQSINVDPINHPPHYTFGGIETIEYMKAKATPEEFKGHLRLTAIKYLSRTGYKRRCVAGFKEGAVVS